MGKDIFSGTPRPQGNRLVTSDEYIIPRYLHPMTTQPILITFEGPCLSFPVISSPRSYGSDLCHETCGLSQEPRL